ncbi:hypothetical protein MCOR25_004277 [Pyricularia grisea]|nr:hypothetical protein MCOR25_004277 [Pyricularia grisea]
MPHIMQALVENGVIDLLGHIEVQHKLMVQFPGAPLLEPGQAFLPGPTPAPPLIFTEFDGTGNHYLLIMVAQHPSQPPDSQFCHWAVAGVPISGGTVEFEQGQTISPYKPPRIDEDNPGRYVFLLLNPKPSAVFNLGGIIAELGGMMSHMGAPVKLNTREFLQGKGLEVVAATVLLG